MTRLFWLFLGIVLIVSGSCSRKTVVRKYYWVDIPRIEVQFANNDLPLSRYVCEIEPVEVASPYNSPRIVFRSDSFEIQYFLNHHWVTSPATAFTEILRYTLEDTRLFSRVEVGSWNLRPQYQVRGEIRALEFVPLKKWGYAHLNMKLRLINLSTGEIVLIHDFDRKVPLTRREMNQFTGAISRIMQEELGAFYNQIAEYLMQRKK